MVDGGEVVSFLLLGEQCPATPVYSNRLRQCKFMFHWPVGHREPRTVVQLCLPGELWKLCRFLLPLALPCCCLSLVICGTSFSRASLRCPGPVACTGSQKDSARTAAPQPAPAQGLNHEQAKSSGVTEKGEGNGDQAIHSTSLHPVSTAS